MTIDKIIRELQKRLQESSIKSYDAMRSGDVSTSRVETGKMLAYSECIDYLRSDTNTTNKAEEITHGDFTLTSYEVENGVLKLGFKTDYGHGKVEMEKSEIAVLFEEYGGGFVKAIGEALARADRRNTAILLQSFKHYVVEYIFKICLSSIDLRNDPRAIPGNFISIQKGY